MHGIHPTPISLQIGPIQYMPTSFTYPSVPISHAHTLPISLKHPLSMTNSHIKIGKLMTPPYLNGYISKTTHFLDFLANAGHTYIIHPCLSTHTTAHIHPISSKQPISSEQSRNKQLPLVRSAIFKTPYHAFPRHFLVNVRVQWVYIRVYLPASVNLKAYCNYSGL